MGAARDPLTHSCDADRGIHRRKHGKGFTYLDHRGERVTDEETLARIRALVIPPAWTDVWICRDTTGHVQATGRDAKNRKQYLYHRRWREYRDAAKFHELVGFGEALPALREQVDADLRAPLLSSDRVVATSASLATLLPLSVSMGPAEWLLYRYRSATHRALQRAHTLAAFGRRAAAALLGAAVGYLAALVTLSAAGVGLVVLLTGDTPELRPLATATIVGSALFLALLLMSFGIRRLVVVTCLLALGADALLLRYAPPEDIQAGTAAGLLAVLLVHALATLRRAQLHH